MRVLESSENTGEDSLLLTFLEPKIELLHLLGNKTDGKDRNTLDVGVLVVDILRYFLDDSRPLIPGHFDAANNCYNLTIGRCTLAAALLMFLMGSTMVLRTNYLKVCRVVVGRDIHKYSLLLF